MLYLLFNEGYAGPSRDDGQRVELSGEAIRLTRMVLRAVPDDSETAGLLALMLLIEARRPARVDERGRFVPLADQDRTRWDREAVAEGVAVLDAAIGSGRVGEYQLQAAIAAVHDRAADAAATDWPHIAALYELLERVTGNPVVTLNRAVAVAMAAVRRPGWRSSPRWSPSCRTTRGCWPSVPTCTSSAATRTRRTPTCARPPPSPPTAGNATTSSPRRPGSGGTPVPAPDRERPDRPRLPAWPGSAASGPGTAPRRTSRHAMDLRSGGGGGPVAFRGVRAPATAAADRSERAREAAARPNMVVVMADDMRADDLRFMPNVRRLVAARGLTYENTFSPYPLCCPARASFLTGQYAHNHRVLGNAAPYGFGGFDDSATVATSLQAAGYRTAFVGKYLNDYGLVPSGVTGESSATYVPAGWNDWHGLLQVPYPVGAGTYHYFHPVLNENGTVRSYEGEYQTTLLGRIVREVVRGGGRRAALLRVPVHAGTT